MKSFTSGNWIFCALSFCALFGATAARADEYTLRVDVPFQFQAGEKLYPAGDYRFTVDSSTHSLKIQPQGNLPISLVPLKDSSEWRTSAASDQGVVRFKTADGMHVLDGLWKPGSTRGSVTYRPKPAKGAISSQADRRASAN